LSELFSIDPYSAPSLSRHKHSETRAMSLSAQNIVFVINSLTAGGAEHALVQLLSRMEDRLQSYTTHLVLLDIADERHKAPCFVTKHVLDAKFSTWKSAYLLTKLMKNLSPAVTLSFLTRANCANVFSSELLGHPCIISERIHTSSHFGKGATATLSRNTVRFAYRRADQIIAVSQGVKQDLVANYGISESRIRAIYNPVDTDRIERQALESPAIHLPQAYILGIGRLVPNKNFRLLIEAYLAANVAESLVILGEGNERPALEALIKQLGLSGRVLLPGYVRNPYPIVKAARLFVCSSNAEGFPNALLEAMALGCPVVSTDCDSGPREILEGLSASQSTDVTAGSWGILVPANTVQSMARAITMALRPEVGKIYQERGKQRAKDFGVETSADQYWSTLAPYLRSR
jgi:N-acetylgalactosamine-N,N'-diacetylbacillosaminyl-diphospho-undecaprenol 4-alpha-N-acetylgalactosaminyltransferase